MTQTIYRLTVLGVIGCVLLGFVSEGAAISVDKWLTAGDTARLFYVAGIVDGWGDVLQEGEAFADTTTHTYQVYKKFHTCITRMTYHQIAGILEKYAKDNPSDWHFSVSSIVWGAVITTCPKNQK